VTSRLIERFVDWLSLTRQTEFFSRSLYSVKKSTASYGTQRVITAFTDFCHRIEESSLQLKAYFFMIHFNIIHSSIPYISQVLLPNGVSSDVAVRITRISCPSHTSPFDHGRSPVLEEDQRLLFPSLSFGLLPLMSKYSLQCFVFKHAQYVLGRSQWPSCPRHELSSPAQTLESWVRILPEAWMSMCTFILCLCSPVCWCCLATG
jgi:hypothetical protein